MSEILFPDAGDVFKAGDRMIFSLPEDDWDRLNGIYQNIGVDGPFKTFNAPFGTFTYRFAVVELRQRPSVVVEVVSRKAVQ